MNPREKGWLKRYLEFRQNLLMDLTGQAAHVGSHPEQSLYRVIQPTGLMYGHTISNIQHPDQESWSDKDRMKVLLAESLISSSLLYQENKINSAEDFSRVIFRTLDNINSFYNNIFPELATPSKTLFGKRKSPLEVTERILDKRMEHVSSMEGSFWTYFFHNSLLFLDVFIFGQWIHTNADRIVADFFRYEREELRFTLIKVIAAAAHANQQIEFEERKLFEYFIQGAGLSSEKKKEAQQVFEGGIEIEEISLPSENSWILRRFFLEIAILTTWADRRVEKLEEDFIQRFNTYLGFNAEDLENSLIAIEGFILEHWEHLVHLQNKQDYKQVSDQFIKRLTAQCEKNQNRILKEIHESEDIMNLIRKARSTELSEKERDVVREGLILVLKTIPTFVIVSLPQHFLTLPILLQVLPKEVFQESNS